MCVHVCTCVYMCVLVVHVWCSFVCGSNVRTCVYMCVYVCTCVYMCVLVVRVWCSFVCGAVYSEQG